MSAGGVSSCDLALLGAAHIHVRDVARVVRSHPRARVVSVFDDDVARAERWASALGAHPFADLDAALDAGDLRGALVHGETSRHRVLVSAAAQRGLAVFVEKPLAASQTDALATSAALADGRGFSTGFFLRYADAFVRLRDTVAAGEVGPVGRAAVRVVHGGLADGWFDGEHAWMREPAQGGGGFFDLVVHGVDLAAWVLGPIARVVEVRLSPSGHHGTAVVRTASGAVVDLEAGWEAPAPALEMTVTGATATLTATGGRLLAGSTVVTAGRPPDAGDAPRAWLDALADQPGRPLVSLGDAVDRVRVTDRLRYRASSDPRRPS